MILKQDYENSINEYKNKEDELYSDLIKRKEENNKSIDLIKDLNNKLKTSQSLMNELNANEESLSNQINTKDMEIIDLKKNFEILTKNKNHIEENFENQKISMIKLDQEYQNNLINLKNQSELLEN